MGNPAALGVQIGNGIAKGTSIHPLSMDVKSQKVIYLDCELSDKQFELRYSEHTSLDDYASNHFEFSSNFLRSEIDLSQSLPDGCLGDFVIESLESEVQRTNARIIIVDNITYLREDNEKAKDALPLMKELKELKQRYSLSILALAHTPKRDHSRPITRNDLAGSKMLINFCDSSFAIGESQEGTNIRYLKQIKERNTSKQYGESNVCVFSLEKPDNFLRFNFSNFSQEQMHLRRVSNEDRNEMIQKAKEMNERGMTQRDIATELGKSPATINSWLKS